MVVICVTELGSSSGLWGIVPGGAAIAGGMGMGALLVLAYGIIAVPLIPLGGIAGLPLGLVAGGLLSCIGARLLVPFRGKRSCSSR
jgi:hypothetical protein